MPNFDKLIICCKPVRDPLLLLRDIPIDLLGDDGREHLRKVNKEVDKRYREIMKRHYRFSPENS
jgi:hypothetical protein